MTKTNQKTPLDFTGKRLNDPDVMLYAATNANDLASMIFGPDEPDAHTHWTRAANLANALASAVDAQPDEIQNGDVYLGTAMFMAFMAMQDANKTEPDHAANYILMLAYTALGLTPVVERASVEVRSSSLDTTQAEA